MKISHIQLALFLALFVAGCRNAPSPDIESRVAHWNASISSEIPIGTQKKDVLIWGQHHGVKFDYLDKQHALYAVVEKIKDPGGSICDEWNIIIQVSLNKNNVSTKQTVETAGTCI